MDRLVADASRLKGKGINVVGIMSNDYISYTADNPENMKKFIADYGVNFPYLIDETQEVARAYDAVCTPDFFGLNNKATLQYRGRIDNLTMKGTGERMPELVNAMTLIAETGHGPKEQTASMGCSIKWK